nr:MAG TPA: hypothetical protein [Caudoviricetes sp.]
MLCYYIGCCKVARVWHNSTNGKIFFISEPIP